MKTLTPENWLEVDPRMRIFVSTRNGWPPQPIEPNWLVEDITAIKLSDAVPAPVLSLFETARGAFCYGYFFYPLYTLAYEKLYLSLETALRLRCRVSGHNDERAKLSSLIKWATANGILSDRDIASWKAVNKIRNIVAHPSGEDVLMFNWAADAFMRAAEQVNSLFEIHNNSGQ